jgi:hypothetical protein
MSRVVWFLMLMLLLLLVNACTPVDSGGVPATGSESAVNTLGSALDWDRSSEAVIVRLDTAGNSGQPYDDLNLIPFCTLFGDGHIVWVDPYADPEEVLEDRLADETFRSFLEYVIGIGFYSWDPETGILLPPTEEAQEGPIVERITVTLYGETRILNAFSNWPSDAFANILDRCQHLSTTPVIFVPQGAWVSAVPVEARSDIPSMPWEVFAASFPDVDLTAMPLDNPRWATGELARVSWEIARAGRMQITDGGVTYRFVVQVPGIQPYAPPAPAAEGSPAAGGGA